MRRNFVIPVLGAVLFFQSTILVDACGDKLMMLGRGIRFQSRHTPRAASVLLYLSTTTHALNDPKIESALTEAGHKLRSVTTREELTAALSTGQYDVVLTDLAEASELQRSLTTDQANMIVVLPAVYLLAPGNPQAKKTDTKKAAQEFGVVLPVPARPGHYCAMVDKAMELKLKRDRSRARRS
ncbi:MAG: hypothetical protein HY646_00960 [Acidobacteria bacterium]|nr:hypothetical protein [Acidobacteriota bacterium]